MSDIPGYFYCPRDTEGLIALTYAERKGLLLNQGNYLVSENKIETGGERIDMECLLDNSRIPTHKTPEAVKPVYGSVPFFTNLIPKK